MKRKSTKFQFAGNESWPVLMLGMSVAAYGQSAPQMRGKILDRLDQLEKDNQALLEEVRALRQEVSGLRTPGPSRTTAPRRQKPPTSARRWTRTESTSWLRPK